MKRRSDGRRTPPATEAKQLNSKGVTPAKLDAFGKAVVLADLLTQARGRIDSSATAQLVTGLVPSLEYAATCKVGAKEKPLIVNRHKVAARICEAVTTLKAAGLSAMAEQLHGDAVEVAELVTALRRCGALLDGIASAPDATGAMQVAGLIDEFSVCRKLVSAQLVMRDDDAGLDAAAIAEDAENAAFVDRVASAMKTLASERDASPDACVEAVING